MKTIALNNFLEKKFCFLWLQMIYISVVPIYQYECDLDHHYKSLLNSHLPQILTYCIL